MNLNPQQLLKEWSSGRLGPVYYLVGEEQLLKSQSLVCLKDRLRLDAFNFSESSAIGTKAAEIVSMASTPPVFAETRLIIIRLVDRLPVSDKKELAQYLENPISSTCLVLLSNTRSRKEQNLLKEDILARASNKTGAIVIFWPLKELEAEKWVLSRIEKTGRRISKEAAHILIGTMGTDTLILSSEIDKLLAYTQESPRRNPISPEQVLNSMGFSKTINPFEFGRSIIMQDTLSAVTLLDKLLDSGEEPVRILNKISGALTKIIKAKRMIASGTGAGKIFREAGVSDYYDKDFISWVNAYKNEARLQKALGKCLEIDALFKSSSGLNPGNTLKQLLSEILEAKHSRRTPVFSIGDASFRAPKTRESGSGRSRS